MKLERATSSDIPALVELLYELFSQELEFVPNKTLQTTALSQIIADENVGFIVVARSETVIVGMVSILFSVSTALGGRVAMLEDMVVSPGARGEKIGSRLLEQATMFAQEAGCKRITLLTDASNRAAQRFYQRSGFEQSSMVVFRKYLTIQ